MLNKRDIDIVAVILHTYVRDCRLYRGVRWCSRYVLTSHHAPECLCLGAETIETTTEDVVVVLLVPGQSL